MGVSKVNYGNSTLIDLTGDSVTPETLLENETAHDRNGNAIVGTATNINNLSTSTNTPADADEIITKESSTWYRKSFSKVWDYVKSKIQASSNEIAYGTCTTSADAAAKEATLVDAGNWTLKKGCMVAIKFTNTNTFSAASGSPVTLNVNNTGAKNIYWGGSSNPTGTNTTPFGRANYINTYLYDGTYWVWQGSSADNNQTGTRQYPTSTNADYRVLFSYGANNNDETNLTRKDADFKYNPSTNNLTVGKINTIPVEDFALEPEINDITDIYGAKNLFNTKGTYTLFTNGSMYEDPTFNSDGTIQFGSFSGGSYYGCDFTDNISFNESIDLIFTSGLTDASDSTAYIEVLYNPSSTVESVRIYNEPVLIEDVSTIDQINLVSIDGHSRLFKPMLRTAGIKSDKYVPYAMTNRELTADLDTLKSNAAKKTDLTNKSITGTTNSTGTKITSGTFFYLNGLLVRAKADIASGATLTLNTNYEAVTAGGLNALNSDLAKYSNIGTYLTKTHTAAANIRSFDIPADKKVIDAKLFDTSKPYIFEWYWDSNNSKLSYVLFTIYQGSLIIKGSSETVTVYYCLIDK